MAVDEARRRALVRELARRCGATLVLFAVVDDHVHLWLCGERAALTRVVRAVGFLLRSATGGAIEAPFIEQVRSRRHMDSLLPYLLTQAAHHGLGAHDAVAAGGAAADLLGARDIGWKPRLWDVCPRTVRRDVHAAVGLPPVELAPAGEDTIARRGVAALVDAAAAAFAAPPDLSGRSAPAMTALRVAAQVAASAGLRQVDLADQVRRSRVSLWRLDPAEERAVRTVRLRVALEVAVAGQPAVQAAPPPEALRASEPPVARPGRRPGVVR
jgi:hypothetical protein